MSTEPSAQTGQPPSAKPSLRIRPARAGDLPALMSLATRLAEFPMPNWRTGGQVIDAERATVARALEVPSPDTPLFVAEDNEGRPVGFALLETHQDYFTGRSHAHVSVLVVSGTMEGRGVGRLLLATAEAWARDRGHPFITLNVFAQNTRARALYERVGFGPETLRYVKPLDQPHDR